MSCGITTGKAILCQNDVGGIDQIVLLNGTDSNVISDVTLTNGVASQVTTADSDISEWYVIDLDKYQSNFNQTIVTSDSGVAYQQDLEIVCRGVQGTTIDLFEDIVAGIWQIMVRDNNGIYYLLDHKKMARCTGGSFIHNGDTALSDPIGFTLQFSAMGTVPALNMTATPTDLENASAVNVIEFSATKITQA
jgi:hypothetical protein|tara:strand:+ start:186 stop:761 length:576 start_codon:yes stop_codon:yes gene_type:complete